jgi:hypothetical protein
MQNMIIDSNDYIQDICFDYYGDRMAVCSTDRKILIYTKSEDSQWIKISGWEVRKTFKLKLRKKRKSC